MSYNQKLSSVIRKLPGEFYGLAKDAALRIESKSGEEGVTVQCSGDSAGLGVLIATALTEMASRNPGALRACIFAACKSVEDEIRELDYEDQKVSKLDEFRLNK